MSDVQHNDATVSPWWRWLFVSAAVVGLDQLTKALAVAWLMPYQPMALMPMANLTLVYNPGAAFSFLADGGGWQRWFLLALSLVISVVLLFWLRRLPASARLATVAIALIIGGALGNAIDRALWGVVIDFIDLYALWGGERYHWPAFNIADSAISVGAVLLVWDGLFGHGASGK